MQSGTEDTITIKKHDLYFQIAKTHKFFKKFQNQLEKQKT